ncbi:hypothetical protein D1841_11695 [Neglecta sp. X4]|uniref:hypothetical protein n=1 Tax=unclassified Neglectibacter TaxID=2632164 RepID=UPI001369D868|nr:MULTISPECIES: hypothetical protein [unclassified Neglectibacter]NBI17381.1 hypothetical protein [Neglectibacter sp. 59]NBJ73926.1 hypothetical protein [Neglectibacter sp. X4]NCE80501.1 hypothetical protein [Neglectibacter sp. X58]
MTFFDTHEKRVTKIAAILSKILEIAYFAAMICVVVMLVLVLVDPALPGRLGPLEELSSRGFSIIIADSQGKLLPGALPVFFIEAALSLGLMSMVFRNVNLILRTSQGQTKFSKGATPFQKDNVRMLREIGLFFIGITVVQIALCGIAVLVLGPENAEVSAGASDLITGILMLCLSECFAAGARMQQDVDGLV